VIARLMRDIQDCLAEGGDWCDLEKAHTLAALVVGLRPHLVVEIGVWMGGSLVPMAMALRLIGEIDRGAGRAVARRAVAIDAWSAAESCVDQTPVNADWWRSADHDAALATFTSRLDKHGLSSLVDVVRSTSDAAEVPSPIDLLHVDGNHAEQARRDVERFAPSVTLGGIMVLDDLDWSGDHVRRAHERALEIGFRDLFPLGRGIVMQRTRAPAG
jgi:predicted O-methyltransferase YrrM